MILGALLTRSLMIAALMESGAARGLEGGCCEGKIIKVSLSQHLPNRDTPPRLLLWDVYYRPEYR